MKRVSPSLLLLLLAPAIGELLSGSSPPLEFFFPPSLILLALMYGCGALVCREMVVRWGKGWLSLLLLGIAYGIYEEGIVLRSFFNSAWQDLVLQPQINPHPESFPQDEGRASALRTPSLRLCGGRGQGMGGSQTPGAAVVLDNLAHYGRWAGVNWVWGEHLTHYRT
jgi:hypothetical protein